MKKAFTLIELMIVIAIIAIIAAIAIPNLLEARKHGNEASAVGSLRTINASEAIYLERSNAQQYGTLTGLSGDAYVDAVLGSGTKQGYTFSATPDIADPEYIYTADGNPAVPGQTGDRYFFTDQGGVIRFALGANADAASNPVGSK